MVFSWSSRAIYISFRCCVRSACSAAHTACSSAVRRLNSNRAARCAAPLALPCTFASSWATGFPKQRSRRLFAAIHRTRSSSEESSSANTPCQSDNILAQRHLVTRPTRHFALRRLMLAKHQANPALRYRQFASHMIDATPSPRGAQKFPRAASCNISLSSVRSQIARRSRRFSFSRSFIRRA